MQFCWWGKGKPTNVTSKQNYTAREGGWGHKHVQTVPEHLYVIDTMWRTPLVPVSLKLSVSPFLKATLQAWYNSGSVSQWVGKSDIERQICKAPGGLQCPVSIAALAHQFTVEVHTRMAFPPAISVLGRYRPASFQSRG